MRCRQFPFSVRQPGDKQLILTLFSRLSCPPRHLVKNYVEGNNDSPTKTLTQPIRLVSVSSKADTRQPLTLSQQHRTITADALLTIIYVTIES